MKTTSPTELTGLFDHRYRSVSGEKVERWFQERMEDMPDGALVRVTFEVLDPHPPESQRPAPTDGGPDCEWCDNKRWKWVNDPSLDGHGGLNGGGWTWRYCHRCNPKGELNDVRPR